MTYVLRRRLLWTSCCSSLAPRHRDSAVTKSAIRTATKARLEKLWRRLGRGLHHGRVARAVRILASRGGPRGRAGAARLACGGDRGAPRLRQDVDRQAPRPQRGALRRRVREPASRSDRAEGSLGGAGAPPAGRVAARSRRVGRHAAGLRRPGPQGPVHPDRLRRPARRRHPPHRHRPRHPGADAAYEPLRERRVERSNLAGRAARV